MKQAICPCCGEKNNFKLLEKDFSTVYGQTSIVSKLFVNHCDNCGATFDADESADKIRQEAFVKARQTSVCQDLEKLEKKISFTELERCFYLAPKTLSKWKNKSKSPSAAAAALVSLLGVFPWLSYVGMLNYNPTEAYKIAFAAVLQKAKENPKNFILPLTNEMYNGVALIHQNNQSYDCSDAMVSNKYSEKLESSTIEYKEDSL